MKLAPFLCFLLFGLANKCDGTERQERRDTVRNFGIELRNKVIESASEEIDVGPILDNLQRLEEDPLDISSATAAELQQIPGVSAQLAHRIVEYRNAHPIGGSQDLQNIKGIDQGVIEAIEPYVSFTDNSSQSGFHRTLTLRTRIVRKLSQSTVQEAGQYLGSPDKVYNRLVGRLSLSSAHQRQKGSTDLLKGSSVTFGLLTAKDPGENNYADLVRGQFVATIPGCSTRIVLGDYLIDGGQGVVFWRPTGFSKGGEATSGVARNGAGIWPSLSTGQSMTFRGIGVNIEPRGFGLHLFYSNKLLDATLDSANTVTHIQSDDLHRTETELAKKGRLREKSFGGRITFDPGGGMKLGVSGFSSRFDHRVSLPGPFGFQGNQSSALGMDALYSDASVCAFAECAQDRSKALSAVVGLTVSLRSDPTLAFLARSFSSRYNNFHSSGFSESGDGSKNESGVYAGLTFRATDWFRVAAYLDQFGFPWRTYGSLMPSQGHEYFFGADIRPRDNVRIELQFRQKDKEEANSSVGLIDMNQSAGEGEGRSTYRAVVSFEPSNLMLWQNCIEIASVEGDHGAGREQGMLICQDMSATLGAGFSVSFRVVAFQSESYASRVYEYEADLPGAYSSPALFDRGFRYYIVGRYRFGRTLALTMKYSQTNTERTGQAGGGIDNQLSIQFDLVL